MFARLTAWAEWHRWFVVAAWMGLAAFAVVAAPSLSSVGITDDSQFLPAGTESSRAQSLIDAHFSDPSARSSLTVVVFRQGGLTGADSDFVRLLYEWLKSDAAPPAISGVTAVFDNPILNNVLVSADGTTMLMHIQLSSQPMDAVSKSAIDALRLFIAGGNHTAEILVSGDAAISRDLFDAIQNTIDRTTLVTIALVTVLLLVAYRSPVAALVPLVAIGLSYLVARGTVGYLAAAGMAISTLADAYMVVVIFGIGTDYCLFIISRFREEMSQGKTHPAVEAMGRIGPIISASAVTVIVAFLCLWTSQFGMTKTVGVALALGVGITLLAGLTLVPALIAIFGRRLFWPLKNHPRVKKTTGWAKAAALIVKRPVFLAVVIIIVLGVPYAALPNLKRSADILSQIPASMESVQGFKLMLEHFPSGETAPVNVLLESTATLIDAQGKNIIDSLVSKLAAVRGVGRAVYFDQPAPALEAFSTQFKALASAPSTSATSGADLAVFNTLSAALTKLPLDYPGVSLSSAFIQSAGLVQAAAPVMAQINLASPAQLPVLFGQLKSMSAALGGSLSSLSAEFRLDLITPFSQWLEKTYFSNDGSVARMSFVLTTDPYADDAQVVIRTLRAAAVEALSGSGVEAYVGGETARHADTLAVTTADFGRVAGLATAGVFVVIVILLRALAAPLYMVATVLFNFGATLGITTFLVQDVFKQGHMIYMLPLFIFVMLVAVGADYNIFLVSRIREEAATRPGKEAVKEAVTHTGGVITTCGIILAGTFATLALAPLQMVYQIGLAIAVGITLDTFIVRALLVPSLAAMLGRLNWWPSKLAQREQTNADL